MPSRTHLAGYAQLYFYDFYEPRTALDFHMQQNAGLSRTIMDGLQSMLLQHHQYVPIYRHAYEILQTYDPANDVEV